jgi:hypothetical protein
MKNSNQTPTEVIDYLVSYFETFGNLPTPVIECQVSGTATTCFGTNLQNKIQKAGGIRELLTTFTSRFVKKELKKEVKAEITPRVKSSKKKKSSETVNVDVTELTEVTA